MYTIFYIYKILTPCDPNRGKNTQLVQFADNVDARANEAHYTRLSSDKV